MMNEQEAKDAARDKGFDYLVNDLYPDNNGFIGDIDPRLAYDAGWESAMEYRDAENQRLRTALEHYANPHNWEYRDDPDEDLNVLCVYVGEFENIECTTGDKIALEALGGE
jgi:hypothetical protein